MIGYSWYSPLLMWLDARNRPGACDCSGPALSMSLENGSYLVNSQATRRPIGRLPIEDMSLNPKALYALPEPHLAPRLNIQKSGNGYKIKAYNDTGVWYDRVHAILLGDMTQAEEWVITAQPQHGDNVYTVERADGSAGWVMSDNTIPFGTPIDVMPLITTHSLPPQYSTTELFTFVRVNE